jgi:hypothetical protein
MPTTVSAAFDELLRRLRLTDRQKEVARGRVSHLRQFFDNNYEVAKSAWPIGSYGRETITRPERDIDVMVALSVAAYWSTYESDSAKFLRWIREGLNREYTDTRVSTRQIAIVIELGEDLQVDLVSGFHRKGGGFLIPDGSGDWMATNPPFHDELMEKSNLRLESSLKPVVRLMKEWNRQNLGHLQSFHMEMLVERIWRSASGRLSMAHATAESLRCAPGWIRTRFPDPWMPTQYIDDYLGPTRREAVAKMLEQDAATAKRAREAEARGDHRTAIAEWGRVFPSEFPAYG